MSGNGNRRKKCSHCGSNIRADDQYCPQCGADISFESGVSDTVNKTQTTADAGSPSTTGSSETPPVGDASEEDSTLLTRRNALLGGATLVGGGVLLGGSVSAWLLVDILSGPKYGDEITDEDLLPPSSAFPSDWEQDDDYNDNFETTYLNEDGTVVVLIEATRYDGVGQAKESFQSTEEGAADANSMSFADEAFWYIRSDNIASTIFRDSNAVGGVSAIQQQGLEVVPDETRSQHYAQKMYQHWQSL